MPRILEFKEIEGALWCKLGVVPNDFPPDGSGYIYLWTKEEAEAAKANAIHNFTWALSEAYLKGYLNALPSPTSID